MERHDHLHPEKKNAGLCYLGCTLLAFLFYKDILKRTYINKPWILELLKDNIRTDIIKYKVRVYLGLS